MPFERRWRQMGAIFETARALHAAGARSRDGTVSAQEKPMPEKDNLAVLREVIDVLTRLDIPYALGGSWASSLLGKMRFTFDADLTVEPFGGKEADFCAAFGPDYYVSPGAVREANLRRSSFNVIHTTSGFKVDLFVRKDRPFEESAMARRRSHPVPQTPGREIVCVSPEDVILFKLEWYHLGGGTSER